MSPGPSPDDVTIPINAEASSVERRLVVGDVVRVETVTTSHDAVIDEILTGEDVEVERVPVRRIVDQAPEVREEGETIIVPVLEEVVVTERRLFLKEEVHIRRVRRTTRHQEVVTLREQDAVVTRTAAKPETET